MQTHTMWMEAHAMRMGASASYSLKLHTNALITYAEDAHIMHANVRMTSMRRLTLVHYHTYFLAQYLLLSLPCGLYCQAKAMSFVLWWVEPVKTLMNLQQFSVVRAQNLLNQSICLSPERIDLLVLLMPPPDPTPIPSDFLIITIIWSLSIDN